MLHDGNLRQFSVSGGIDIRACNYGKMNCWARSPLLWLNQIKKHEDSETGKL